MSKNLPDIDDLNALRTWGKFPPYCHSLWMELRNRMHDGHIQAWPKAETIAEATGWSLKSIQRAIKISRECHILKVERRKNNKFKQYQSNKYNFNLDKREREKSMPFSKIITFTAYKSSKSHRTESPKAMGLGVPRTNNNRTTKKKTTKEKTASPSSAASSAVAVEANKIAPWVTQSHGSEFTEEELFAKPSELKAKGYDIIDLADPYTDLGEARQKAKAAFMDELRERGVKGVSDLVKKEGLAKMARYREFLYKDVPNPPGLFIQAMRDNYLDKEA